MATTPPRCGRVESVSAVNTLTVLYDADCELCRRCRDWLSAQPAFVPLEFVAAASDEAAARFGNLGRGEQLVVVSDDGRVWAGSPAFVMSLWALKEWREWSLRLAAPGLSSLAEAFFRVLSAERRRLAALFDHRPCADGHCGVVPGRAGPYR